MKEILNLIKKMEKEKDGIKMEMSIKENGKIILNKVKE